MPVSSVGVLKRQYHMLEQQMQLVVPEKLHHIAAFQLPPLLPRMRLDRPVMRLEGQKRPLVALERPELATTAVGQKRLPVPPERPVPATIAGGLGRPVLAMTAEEPGRPELVSSVVGLKRRPPGLKRLVPVSSVA